MPRLLTEPDASAFRLMSAKPCDRPCQRKPSGERKTHDDLDHAIRQRVSKAITAEDEIIDVFTAAGIKRPNISILSSMKSSSPKCAA